ncbi:polyol transporter 5-like [Cucumis melo var. makuwa]|uniref:Polyol transporter 5-like n=1 Tax=Cucumis melo var. makuwa TaxID=1194695 RepID=A0A5D3DGE4_CUCMM|nr:polyol transporter 5-like [Cucumis melo var. makuwa]
MGSRKDEISPTSGLQIPLINPHNRKTNHFPFLCSLIASMASILAGYDIGVMSGAAIFIKDDFKISDVQVEVLVGIINLYSILAAAAAGRTSDRIGRRYTIVLAAGFFVVGAILMGFAPNYAFLMFGRFFAGAGIGCAPLAASVYTAEISPASSRGSLSTLQEVLINLGILLGYVSNYAFSKLPIHLGWRFMLGIGLVPSLFLAVLVILVMPESPRWLIMQGRVGEAKQVLIKTSDSIEESLHRLADIKSAVGIPPTCENDIVHVPKLSIHGSSIWKELFLHPTPAVRHIIITVVGLHFFLEATGTDAVLLYSPRIFEKAGITSPDQKLVATVGVGLTKTLFVLMATVLLDRIGRRPLVLTSIAGQTISLMVLGTGLTIMEKSEERMRWAVGMCIATVLSDVAFYSIGMGPMAFVSSEFFSLKLRAQGMSVGVMVNRLVGAIVTMTFLSLSSAITIGGAFFLYAGIALLALVFFYVVLPETYGMNLENVEGVFGNLTWIFSANE